MRSAGGDDAALIAETLDLLARHAEGADPLDAIDPWLAPPPVPERIGPYRVLGLLGQGGMGLVYRARAQTPDGSDADGPDVALKVLRAGTISGQLERRFQREIEVLRRLDHPGIARLLDAGFADGAPYLAAEFCDGPTLNRWRVESGASTDERLRLLADLCDAVQAAHDEGVIHRDLKPENIVVMPGGRPKVLDFGIARLTDDSAPLATLATQTWQLLGTIRYMSPEQAAGGGAAIDARTDIYTLGVLAYELLTGALPYDLKRLSTPRALLEITTAEPRPLGGHHPVPGLIVQRALEKDPDRRYQTAAAMADDLRRHLAGLPVSVRPPGPLTRLRRGLRARPRLRRAVLGLAIVAVTSLATLTLTLRGAEPAPSWSRFYGYLEQADRLRHAGPQTRDNCRAAIVAFHQARLELARLPQEVYSGDLRRYVKWRLGELHYFLGGMDHDAGLLEQARGYWRDASLETWSRGSALAIDPRVVSRTNVLRLGAHQAYSGMGLALSGLAGMQAPATNLKAAFGYHTQALDIMGDGSRNFHDDSTQPFEVTTSRAFINLDRGNTLSALGATIDSLATVERGLRLLRAAAAMGGIRDANGLSMLAEAQGVAFMRLANLQPSAAAAASLDSAQAHLSRASAQRGASDGRRFWRMCRLRGQVWERMAKLAGDDGERQRRLERAARDYRDCLIPLDPEADGFELALTRTDLAGVEAALADLAAPAGLTCQKSRFARADSLLALESPFTDNSHFPLQYAETEWRRGQIARLRWQAFGERADSLGAVEAFGHARAAVPGLEFPALQRRLRDEEAALAAARR